MNPSMPDVIDRYLRAHDRLDTDATLATFAADATVVDERHRVAVDQRALDEPAHHTPEHAEPPLGCIRNQRERGGVVEERARQDRARFAHLIA